MRFVCEDLNRYTDELPLMVMKKRESHSLKIRYPLDLLL